MPNMSNNTTFFKTIVGKNRFGGAPSTKLNCTEHDANGPFTVYNANGNQFTEADIPDPDIDLTANQNFYTQNNIIGSHLSCSKCGQLMVIANHTPIYENYILYQLL